MGDFLRKILTKIGLSFKYIFVDLKIKMAATGSGMMGCLWELPVWEFGKSK